MSELKWIVFTSFFSFILGTTFQNCSTNILSGNYKPKIELIPIQHPSLNYESDSTSSPEIVLIDRQAVASKMVNLFLDSESTEEHKNLVSTVLSYEIIPQQHMFGRSCDYLSSGSISDCNFNLANLSLPMNQNSSTIRIASKIQVCRKLVSNDSLFESFLKRFKIDINTFGEVDLKILLFLFYPTAEFQDSDFQAFINLNNEMIKNGESVFTRLRILTTSICESPYWEIL